MPPTHALAMHADRARSPCMRLQEQGDIAFKGGKLQPAVELYGEAIDNATAAEAALQAAATNNRALAMLKLNRPADAYADCDAVLAVEPDNVKAVFRKAEACRLLGRHDDARALLQRCLELQPSNSAAAAALEKLGGGGER